MDRNFRNRFSGVSRNGPLLLRIAALCSLSKNCVVEGFYCWLLLTCLEYIFGTLDYNLMRNTSRQRPPSHSLRLRSICGQLRKFISSPLFYHRFQNWTAFVTCQRRKKEGHLDLLPPFLYGNGTRTDVHVQRNNMWYVEMAAECPPKIALTSKFEMLR